MKKPLISTNSKDKSVDTLDERERIIVHSPIIRFGERLKEAMGDMSFTELSRRSGLSDTTIRKYVQGKIFPGIDSAALVAHACGVSLMWLLTGEQKDENNNYDPDNCSQLITNHQQPNELELLLQRVSPQDKSRLVDALCNFGIKGILNQLQTKVNDSAINSPGTLEEAIQALPIRDSLKEAITVAIQGNEQTDKEILRRIKQRARAGATGGGSNATPQDNNTLKKSG